MKKLLITIATALLLLCLSGIATATPVSIIEQNAEWYYSIITNPPDLNDNWAAASHDSFDWGAATYETGNAAFGNTPNYANSGLYYNTLWEADTDLALSKVIHLDGNLLDPVTLNVASDNGFMVFVNGQMVAKKMAEGFTSIWEYELSISNSPFVTGFNVIEVLAEDHGGITYFDMELIGQVSPVPEPATMMLFGLGLLGLAGISRKKAKHSFT